MTRPNRPDWLPETREAGTYPEAVIEIEGWGFFFRPLLRQRREVCAYGVCLDESDDDPIVVHEFSDDSLYYGPGLGVTWYEMIPDEPLEAKVERKDKVGAALLSFFGQFPEFVAEVRYCHALEFGLPLPERPRW